MTLIAPAVTVAQGSSATGDVRTVSKGLSSFPATGEFTPSGINDVATDEFAQEEEDEDADAGENEDFDGNIGAVSLSNGHASFIPSPFSPTCLTTDDLAR